MSCHEYAQRLLPLDVSRLPQPETPQVLCASDTNIN